nr:hypothetical protein GCM10020063_061210 [Dactylosporangium thailandense]
MPVAVAAAAPAAGSGSLPVTGGNLAGVTATALLSLALGVALLAAGRVRRGLRRRLLPPGCAYNC